MNLRVKVPWKSLIDFRSQMTGSLLGVAENEEGVVVMVATIHSIKIGGVGRLEKIIFMKTV